MFRGLFRFIALLVFFAVIRYVVVTVARFFSQTMGSGAAPPSESPTAAGPTRGELKKDPVCGTFVSTGSSVKQMVNGELVHFCSTTCRDKFRAA